MLLLTLLLHSTLYLVRNNYEKLPSSFAYLHEPPVYLSKLLKPPLYVNNVNLEGGFGDIENLSGGPSKWPYVVYLHEQSGCYQVYNMANLGV